MTYVNMLYKIFNNTEINFNKTKKQQKKTKKL